MYSAIVYKGENSIERVYASYELDRKSRGYYRCPVCSEPVMLKKGEIKVPHFSHYPGERGDCKAEWEPESKLHIDMKEYFYKLLRDKYNFVEIEYKIGSYLADVYFESDNMKVAIECQCSKCSHKRMEEKTVYYLNRGVYTIWVCAGEVKSPVVIVSSPDIPDTYVINRFCSDKAVAGLRTSTEWEFYSIKPVAKVGKWSGFNIELAYFVPDYSSGGDEVEDNIEGKGEVDSSQHELGIVELREPDVVVRYSVIRGKNVRCVACGGMLFERGYGCVAGMCLEGNGYIDALCDCGRVVRVIL